MTFEEFFKRFTKVERRRGYFRFRFAGVQLYALLRVRLFYAIAQELGLFENPHPTFEKPELDDSVARYENLANPPKAETVIVPFRRRVAGGEPYSDRIREQLLAAGKQPLTIDFLPSESALQSTSPTSPDELDLTRLREYFAREHEAWANKILRRKSRRPAELRYHYMIRGFEREYGVSLEKFHKYPQWLIRRTLVEQRGFAELFEAMGTKKLYLVNAYSEPSIVLGAKQAGVKVYEIQHGFISPMHPAYSFDKAIGRRKVDSAPDVILTWGEYWGSNLKLARGTSTQVSGPTRAFAEYRNRVANQDRGTRQVLFSSQGAIGQELCRQAISAARKLPKNEVIFRLHPNESLDDYIALAQLIAESEGRNLPSNFMLSHKDPIFLDLLATSEYVIGAFSTTLFEALALGCKVLCLPLPGFENLQPAIDAGDITLISNLEDITLLMRQSKPSEHPERYYAK